MSFLYTASDSYDDYVWGGRRFSDFCVFVVKHGQIYLYIIPRYVVCIVADFKMAKRGGPLVFVWGDSSAISQVN